MLMTRKNLQVLAWLRAHRKQRFSARDLAPIIDADGEYLRRIMVQAMKHCGDIKRDKTVSPYLYWAE